MNQPHSKGIRAFSAKLSQNRTEKGRPMSGVTTLTQNRKQVIQNVYINQMLAFSSRQHSAKSHFQGNCVLAIENQVAPIKKKLSLKGSKQKQELQEQNLNLKRTINNLVAEVSQIRNKLQFARKKSCKFTKTLAMEFQKDIYFSTNSNNNHVIAGIKNVYENLKQKYEEKCQQYQQMSKKKNITKELQHNTYIETLQTQNKALSQRFQRISASSINILTGNASQRQASDFLFGELESQREQLLKKIIELQIKYKMSFEGFKDRNKKIELLDKLIIEKDNAQHAITLKWKNSEKHSHEVQEKYTVQLQELRQTNALLERSLQQLKLEQKIAEDSLMDRLSQEARQNDIKVRSLEKENSYLEQMIKQLRSTNNQLNLSVQDMKSTKIASSIQNLAPFAAAQRKTSAQEKKYQVKLSKNQVQQHEKGKNKNGIYENGHRVPQKANKKHNQNAIKRRRIQYTQISYISQFLKYKLIGLKMPIQEIKGCLDFNQAEFRSASSSSQISREELEWKKQHINMEQVYTILRNEDLNLNHEDALIFSRYLIEDVHDQFVYSDNSNQNTRNIVKAIIKNAVGQYQIYPEGQNVNQKTNQFILKYRTNLQQQLQSVAPFGHISKKKLLELFHFLNILLQQEVIQCIISRLALCSTKITELSYKPLI